MTTKKKKVRNKRPDDYKEQIEQRNTRVIDLVAEQGWTLAAAGAEVGLTQERVRQIVQRARPGLDLTERNLRRRAEFTRERKEIKKTQIIERKKQAKMTNPRVHELVQPDFTREEMLEKLVDAFVELDGKPPTTVFWKGKRPSVTTYMRIFGSWDNALEEAGVGRRRDLGNRAGPPRQWTDDRILAVLYEFLCTDDVSKQEMYGTSHYERWRKTHGGAAAAPSRSTIIQRFSTWQAAKTRAIEKYGKPPTLNAYIEDQGN
jgi:hypothetical protein